LALVVNYSTAVENKLSLKFAVSRNKTHFNLLSHRQVWHVNYFPGNEARHVTIKIDSAANRAAAAAVPPTSYIYTTLPGVSISFVGKLFC